jgi:hypothetical protein
VQDRISLLAARSCQLQIAEEKLNITAQKLQAELDALNHGSVS